MPTDSFIQLATDGAGKQLDTLIFNMGAGTTAVHRELMVLADPTSTSGFATVTSSAGLQVNISSGTISTLTSGSLVLSSASGVTPTNIVGTSSAIAPATSSGGLLVTAIPSSNFTVQSTFATNPWSSAPGFNIPIVSVSSGLVQISGVPSFIISSSAGLATITAVSASSGLVQISGTIGLSTAAAANLVQIVTSSAGSLVATTSQGLQVQQSTSKIVPVLQASSGVTSIDLWQGTSAFVATFNSATTITKVSSSAGTLYSAFGFTTGSTATASQALIRFYNATTSNVSAGVSLTAVMILPILTTQPSAASDAGNVANMFGAIGLPFGTACSFDIATNVTSSGGTPPVGYVTTLFK